MISRFGYSIYFLGTVGTIDIATAIGITIGLPATLRRVGHGKRAGAALLKVTSTCGVVHLSVSAYSKDPDIRYIEMIFKRLCEYYMLIVTRNRVHMQFKVPRISMAKYVHMKIAIIMI